MTQMPLDILLNTLKTAGAALEGCRAELLAFAIAAAGAGFGAWFGARAAVKPQLQAREADIQATVNVAIASMVALLGKLINFKRDLSAPAEQETRQLGEALARADKGKISIKLELWPEIPFALRLPNERLFEYAGSELDLIQLLKTLDFSLHELAHLVAQRNELIRGMNQHQAVKGALPVDGLNLYARYASEISRNVDENLFFLDRGIEKTRDAAKRLLPKRLHNTIAEIGLRPETSALMPPGDLIKGWVK